jgi:4'-phosphopantetheinyl transferase
VTDLIALTPSEVHAWHGRTSEPGSEPGEPRESDLAILSADERSRCGRFVRQADRVRFAATHAAVRRLLARYLAAQPADVRFGRTACCECGSAEHGPPRIDWPPTDITCNLSGSGEHWLLAVTRGRRVGADIEVARDVDTGQLALICLTAAEQQYLSTRREDERLGVFYRCWTRKEAVLKACGVGLPSSLRDLEVSPGRDGQVEVRHRCKAGQDRWIVQDLPARSGPAGAGGVAGAGWLGAVAQPAADAGRVWFREAADAGLP